MSTILFREFFSMFDNFLAVFLPGFNLIDFQLQAQTLLITARPAASTSPCPRCNIPSARIHSYYTRRPKDLPLAGFAVGLFLQVRRFRCLNPACQAATFAERLPQLIAPTAQRTIRLTLNLHSLALALGGEAGTRYAAKGAIVVSPDTLLRLLKQTKLPERPTPRVLAVDDFALRKGHRYGTLLVDGETHHPIELLEDRTADTLAQWLRQHPGVEIITRDRSTEYARGASEGAPAAIQLADRWHLLTNWREALERGLERLRPHLQNTLTLPGVVPESELPPISVYERQRRRGTKDQMVQQTRRTQRYEIYRRVKDLQKQGYNLRQVARELKLGLRRVRRYFTSEQFPEQARPPRAKSILDPYAAYLQQRWDSGCHNNRQLWHEIQAQGYNGSIRPLVQWTMLRRERANGGQVGRGRTPVRQVEIFPPASTPASGTTLPASRRLVWWLLLKQEKLKPAEAELVQTLRELPQFEQVYELSQQFMTMVRERNGALLNSWLKAALGSDLSEVVSFATGLKREEAIIQAALDYPYSNGVAEGHVNRLKMIKRTMYGRASFPLLRQRVLAA